VSLPLAGTRVLDLTNVIAGPLASYLLALMGAEVIKVEVPGIGDLSRKMGADPAMGRQQMGASYLAFNAGKKSITLNLKSERGKQLFRKLCMDADVVLENFRPGAMQRLDLGAETLRALNPRLIYCAVSGFGQTGPLAQRASYDQIIQGYCGLMALTGEPETAPVKAGLVVCDTTAAITAAFAIAAALVKRNATGEGEVIDVSMLDCALASMSSWVISNYLNAGYAAQPVGNHSQTSAPSGTFRTGDAPLNIVNNEQKQFQATCDALGLPELKTDPRFAERDARMQHQPELQAILEAKLAEAGAATWEQRLAEAGVPVGPVLSVPQVAEHAQLRERGQLQTVHVPALDRDVQVVGLGFQLGGKPVPIALPPPALGEHTRDVLRGLGCSDEEIGALQAEGVV
jgi:crotonobetainyl-CoA:carnitine CoA-transferase CaiB-like acyl-CoA transferase